MNPTLKDQLQQWKKLNNFRTKPAYKRKKIRRQPVKRKTESLSRREWENIMGMNRQTLFRGRGGAFKQR